MEKILAVMYCNTASTNEILHWRQKYAIYCDALFCCVYITKQTVLWLIFNECFFVYPVLLCLDELLEGVFAIRRANYHTSCGYRLGRCCYGHRAALPFFSRLFRKIPRSKLVTYHPHGRRSYLSEPFLCPFCRPSLHKSNPNTTVSYISGVPF